MSNHLAQRPIFRQNAQLAVQRRVILRWLLALKNRWAMAEWWVATMLQESMQY
jgi:hypothetical protein